MAGITELLSLLSEVFGLTGSFKRRVAIIILHLIGAYVLANLLFSLLFSFLAERFATFSFAQFIATASPDLLNLLKFLAFLLSLIAVILSLHLLRTSIIRDFFLTKIEIQVLKKLMKYALSELSVREAIVEVLSDIVKDLQFGSVRVIIYIVIPIILYYISLGALLSSVCNLFNATFLCPNYALPSKPEVTDLFSSTVWQVGAVFLSVHIVHTWLYVESNGEYSLYPHFRLYVLRGAIRRLLLNVRRKQENQRNDSSPPRLSEHPIEFFILTLLASLVPPLPIPTKPKTFVAILLPMTKQVSCYGTPTTSDQRNQICLTGKWQKEEAFASLLSALREVAGDTAKLFICDSSQIASETIKKLEKRKDINKIPQECSIDNSKYSFYGPLMFRYNLFQCMLDAIYKAFEKGRMGLYDMLIVAELQLVNGIPVRYEVMTGRGRREIKECYCRLEVDQVNDKTKNVDQNQTNKYYPIYLIAAWGDTAEEISQIPLCIPPPTQT